MKQMKLCCLVLVLAVSITSATEYHVSVKGDDANDGSALKPWKTINAAVRVAQPGDVITVHEGVYREQINPPRGGTSDRNRIVYRAAEGEKVVIKGSEVVKGWEKVQHDTWKVTLPNSFFGDFNPYNDLIHGDWFIAKEREHHTGAVYRNGHWLVEAATLDAALEPAGDTPFWFGQVDPTHTAIWAQFKDINPNEADVEINVRRTVFYPSARGINYITVRGFTMMQAATPWSPPTTEQIGLIGTHWSKGWIIENNDIRYSTCAGVTLGKYGDQFDDEPVSTAEGYNKTIERALENGWNKETIGHHIVRGNTISHCEQAGIVGSLGAVFSTLTGNVIHDIHVRVLFSGHEMAGIKIHGAIDMEISRNHVYRCCRGIWLDWMAQGTRVTGNLLHENGLEDFFPEVNHGPFVVDNNIFLSRTALRDWSHGGAYAHNLFAGRIMRNRVLNRETPFHKAHSTEIAGLQNIQGGDSRFYYNIFVGEEGLAPYDQAALPVQMAGNVFLKGANASVHEKDPLVRVEFDPELKMVHENAAVTVSFTLDPSVHDLCTRNGLIDDTHSQNNLVSTELLGKTAISGLPFLNVDGSPLKIESDYFGVKRNPENPTAGPFEKLSDGPLSLKVWPLNRKVQP